MSESQAKVIYTVYARISNRADIAPYVKWLETTHMKDVLSQGGAVRAELLIHEENPEGYAVEGRYEFPSKEALVRYVREHAPELRQEAIQRFPDNQYTRYVSFPKAEIALSDCIDKKTTYEGLIRQVDNMFSADLPLMSRLSSAIALIKSTFKCVSWVGFYEAQGETLYVGSYQGPLACSMIPFGKGVCGHVAKTLKTEIVEDVEKFPGHIACDSLSRSEIVLPVVIDGKLRGVLDVDSHLIGAFDQVDAEYLEKIIEKIVKGIM